MSKRILQVLLSRTFILLILALLQTTFFFVVFYWFANIGLAAYWLITALTVVLAISLLLKDNVNPAYKLIWLLCLFLLPVFGTVFYLLWGRRRLPRRSQAQMQKLLLHTKKAMIQNKAILNKLCTESPTLGQSAIYLLKSAASPVYLAQVTEYYPLGQDFFPAFIDAIKNAKKYIFMEYYLLEDGMMLETTTKILAQKAAEGVDVRLVWDGFGSLFTLPHGFLKNMQKKGIKCQPFSPLELSLHASDYAMLNHRDHRKITVVDGEIGFTGGINFADEYINAKERFGVWKDSTVKITGAGVYSLTTIFLRAWDFATKTESQLENYRHMQDENQKPSLENGYVQPFWDSPLDDETVSENAYFNVIRHAKNYVYISTPYLILDNEMITMLTLAAKSGVDVRILTPGIPDKRVVYWVSQSYYPVLLNGGVRIFEYTPGFNHAKLYVCDDEQAIIGSANMDYRSLFSHFENCISFYGGTVPVKVKKDMLACFDASHEVTLEETKQIPLKHRFIRAFAKFFSPLL